MRFRPRSPSSRRLAVVVGGAFKGVNIDVGGGPVTSGTNGAAASSYVVEFGD